MPRPGQGSSNGSRQSSSRSFSTRQSTGRRFSSSSGVNPRPGSSSSPNIHPASPAGGPSTYNRRDSFRQPGIGPRSAGPGNVNRGSSLFPFLLGSMMGSQRARRSYSAHPPYDPGMPPQTPVPGRRRSGGSIAGIILLIILIVLFFTMCGCSSANQGITESSYNREKIQSSEPYVMDCITDEEGWFENVSNTENRLKTFYEKTGVQPMIVIRSYDPSLKTDEQKDQFAQQYFEEYAPNEDTFMYMYFGEPGDSEIGYMDTVSGHQAASMMDAQARDIFLDYLEQEWTSGKSTDDLFVSAFDQTANRIMTKTATSKDVWSKALIVLAIVAIGAGILIVMKVKRNHEAQRAAETERILKTPIQPLHPTSADSSASTQPESGSYPQDDEDDLLKKYGG